MPDRFGKEIRSKIMRRIRSKDTTPERVVRSYLHTAGFRFRLHAKGLPQKPDIVLPKYRTIVFVHGCFWHQHPGCKHRHIPKSNKAYWRQKLRKNVVRDARNRASLEVLGWKVLVLWECDILKGNLRLLPSKIRMRGRA